MRQYISRVLTEVLLYIKAEKEYNQIQYTPEKECKCVQTGMCVQAASVYRLRCVNNNKDEDNTGIP